MMLAEPIISVLYQHGRFDADETAQAAGALRFYAIGLAGYAALKVLVNAFYALDQRKTPMLVSFMAVALNLLFNWIFTFRLGWGHRGLAFSTGCVATCNFLVLYCADASPSARSRVAAHVGDAWQGRGGFAGARGAVRSPRRTGCWRIGRLRPFWSRLGALLATIVAGAAVFVACGALLGIEELDELMDGPPAARPAHAERRHCLAQIASPLSNTMCQVCVPSSLHTELNRPTSRP